MSKPHVLCATVMDEKIRNKYADTSLRTYMENAVNKTKPSLSNGQTQQVGY